LIPISLKNPIASLRVFIVDNHKWNSDTVTIPSDEYGAMCAKIDANELEKISAGTQDEIQVIINGTRYNLS